MARKKNKAKGGQVADTDNQEEVVVPEPVIPQVADTGIALTEIKLAVENEDDETDQLLSVVEVVAKVGALVVYDCSFFVECCLCMVLRILVFERSKS